VAIWNGIDVSTAPWTETKYDKVAIYTGSAVVVPGAGPGGVPGVVNIYPGLCTKEDWPACSTGTLLAQAVPADYADDELLVNWTKPSYNPVVEGTERDPSSPWKEASGEWRLRTYDQMVYGAASDADMLAGKWYTIGKADYFRGCECPSFYPLPAATPGFEQEYAAAQAAGALPTHVHKTSCGCGARPCDLWQAGTYGAPAPKVLGNFSATPGWEDLFVQRQIDEGAFYASKDSEYPTLAGGRRRVNWGWATVAPASAQSLPREVTFNAAARALQQYPVEEVEQLRGPAAGSVSEAGVGPGLLALLALPDGVGRQMETLVSFALPKQAAKLVLSVGVKPHAACDTNLSAHMVGVDFAGGDLLKQHFPDGTPPSVCQALCASTPGCLSWTFVSRNTFALAGLGFDCYPKNGILCPQNDPACVSGVMTDTCLWCGSSSGLSCEVDYTPPPAAAVASGAPYSVPVSCGLNAHDPQNYVADSLLLLPSETAVEVRVFSDWTFAEVFFQRGRTAMTAHAAFGNCSSVAMSASAATTASATAWPMKSIWTTEAAVRAAPRVYSYTDEEV
jgi:sucrose-6-phosphate hydrolase SacC (GH32 family)